MKKTKLFSFFLCLLSAAMLFTSCINLLPKEFTGDFSAIPFPDKTFVPDSLYPRANSFAISDSRFAWIHYGSFSYGLCMVKSDESFVTNSSMTDTNFQLLDKGLLYCDYDQLKYWESGASSPKILDRADGSFFSDGSKVYYSRPREEDSYDSRTSDLYCYDLKTEESKRICEEVSFFYLHHGQLYVLLTNGWLTRIPEQGSPEKLFQLDIDLYPVLPTENAVIYGDNCRLVKKSLTDGTETKLSLTDEPQNHYLSQLVCDDNFAYLILEYWGGEETVSQDSGLWKVDLSTMEAQKLSGEEFYEIALCDDSSLLLSTYEDHYFSFDLASETLKKIL